MSRLLSASFLRLRKDKLFWIGMLFMVAAGIFIPVMRYMDMQRSQYTVTIDNGFFCWQYFDRYCKCSIL